MKAVVWRGDRTLDIETVEDARLEASTDVLMRLTSTAICGTDLHIYEGRMGEVDGMVIGHEPLGVVEEVGSHRLPLSQAPDAYKKFDQRIDRYIKVVLDPNK